ncbi:MAG: hypothetical protein V4795_01995 [Pseudomonadota bacterium]
MRIVNPFGLVARLVVMATVSALVACGGGGDDAGDQMQAGAGTAEGVYGGTLVGSPSPEFQLLVLPDGEYWSMYGSTVGGTFVVAGFVQGTGTSSNGAFTSTNGKDFGMFPAGSGTVSASYDTTAKTISGSIAATGANITFAGGPLSGSNYVYQAPADLAAVAGNWTGANIGGETVSMAVAANGSLTTTTSGGCNATGTVSPRTDGRNAFTVTLLQGVGCALQGQTIRGIVLVYPLAAGGTQLIGAVIDDARTAGTAVFARR